jgi:hypothetical protein
VCRPDGPARQREESQEGNLDPESATGELEMTLFRNDTNDNTGRTNALMTTREMGNMTAQVPNRMVTMVRRGIVGAVLLGTLIVPSLMNSPLAAAGACLTCTNGPSTLLDNDRDGLNNYEESRYRTDPKKRDTDGDGWSDYAEIKGCISCSPKMYGDPLNPKDHPSSPLH